MSFSTPFFSRHKKELVIIFDIGSASVGGALVLLGEGSPPSILYTARMEIKISQKQTAERFLLVLKNALEAVARLLEREGLHSIRTTHNIVAAPARVECFFTSPWYTSSIRTLRLSGEHPLFITEEMVKKMIEKEVGLLSHERRSEYGERGFALAEGVPHLVEAKIVSSFLNGYSVGQVVGKQAKTFEMTLYASFLPEGVVAIVEGAVHRAFNLKKIWYHSFAVPFFSVARDLWGAHGSFLLADIGGEMTDVFGARGHSLSGVTSFPFGRNTIVRRCAKLRGSSFPETTSLFNLYFSGKADKKTRESLERDLAILRDEWAQLFRQSISFVVEKGAVPRVVFLLAADPLARVFTDAIASITLPPLSVKFSVHRLTQKIFAGLVPVNDVATSDVFLSVEALFTQKQFETARTHPFFLYKAVNDTI